MENLYIYLAVGAGIIFFFVGWYMRIKGRQELVQNLLEQQNNKEQAPSFGSTNPEVRRLQLQAYERLIILCERLALPSLLGRFQPQELNAVQLQQSLIQTIKSEFEYNVSQQLYVSPAAWDAMKNLKEQQIYIINQVAALIPANATGMELAKQLAELLTHDENATLQPIVAALLNKEARQLMQ